MQPIKIEGISQDPVQFGVKITLTSGKDKYVFFNKKKDGSDTKAYAQFKKYGFSIGETVNAEVKSEAGSFPNKEGKQINYTRRTILYFQEVENTPVITKEAPKSQIEPSVLTLESLDKRLKVVENWKAEKSAEDGSPF